MNTNPENRKRKRPFFLSDVQVVGNSEQNDSHNNDDHRNEKLAGRKSCRDLIAVLKNGIDHFESEVSSSLSHSSQQQIRVHQNRSSKILSCMQEILLQLPISSTEESPHEILNIAFYEVQNALTLLIEYWEPGNTLIYTILIETLLRSFSGASLCNRDTLLFGEIRVQQFILSELLPLATGGMSEKCHHAQSIIAKALLQSLALWRNASTIDLIISWCRWYINHFHFHLPKLCDNSVITLQSAPSSSFTLAAEIYQLGLELFKSLQDIDLLPIAASLIFDLFSLMVTSNTMNYPSMEKHANIIIATLRRQLITYLIPRKLHPKPSNSMLVDTDKICEDGNVVECHQQIVQLLVATLQDEDTNLGRLLTKAYLQQLTLSLERITVSNCFETGKKLSNRLHDLTSTNDHVCEAISGNLLTIDWIFLSIVLSSSSPHFQSIGTSIIEGVVTGDVDCTHTQFDCISTTLLAVLDILFLDRLSGDINTRHTSSDSSATPPNSILESQQYRNTVQRLIPCVLRLAVVLLYCPQSCDLSYLSKFEDSTNMIESGIVDYRKRKNDPPKLSRPLVHQFIFHLYIGLDCHGQKELIRTLLCLVDEFSHNEASKFTDTQLCAFQGIDIFRYQSDRMGIRESLVVRTVFAILERIVYENPTTLLCFKNLLIERLTRTATFDGTPSNKQYDRHFCCLLVSLMSTLSNTIDNDPNTDGKVGLGSSEMILLAQKLLLGESLINDTSRPARGIMLATELMFTETKTTNERNCIIEWVVRCLLPVTRRMVEPELGLAGLSFLIAWRDWNKNNNNLSANSLVFKHFKMMLANTGLIQSFDKHQAGNLDDSSTELEYFLAYSVPTSTYQVNLEASPKAIVFGIHFFLRHSNGFVNNPLRWSHATDWVYGLIDTYLQIGRTTSRKRWHPCNWLRACLQFPKIDTSFFKTSVEAQNSVVHWIQTILCNFELSNGTREFQFSQVSFSDTIVRSLSTKKLHRFIDSLQSFAFAVLVGISLSSAVLKNAYHHARHAENDMLRYHELMKYQIRKIYDLRMKSATLESLCSAIDAALRRSLLRKKRTAIVLSDTSSDDNSIAILPPTSSTAQKIITLNCLYETTRRTRNIRQAFFSSNTKIESCVLWNELRDTSDCRLLRTYVDYVYSNKTDELRDSFDDFAQMIQTKVNVMHHITEQLQNRSLLEDEVNESDVKHGLNEIDYLFSNLRELRILCLQRVDNISTCRYKLLALVVRFAVSYLKVIGLIIQNAYSQYRLMKGERAINASDLSLERFVNAFHHFQSDSALSAHETSLNIIFDYFADHLCSTEYASVADGIFEIMASIASIDVDTLVPRLIHLSWTSIHTVYVNNDNNDDCCNINMNKSPYVVPVMGYKVPRKVYNASHKARLCIVQSILRKLYRQRFDKNPQLLNLSVGTIRHWEILNSSDIGLPYLLSHLSTLVSSLATILASVSRTSKSAESTNAEVESKVSQKKKLSQVSSIVGLDVTTYSEFYDILLNLIVATAGILNPRRPINHNDASPYKDIQDCFGIYRCLLEMYKNYLCLFPPKNAFSIFYASKDLLAIAIYHLENCVEWRMDQPLGTDQKQWTGQGDMGSIQFLEDFIDRILSHTATPILSLCDLWEITDGKVSLNKARISLLRVTVEKAIRRIKDISLMHNFGSPSFGVACEKIAPVDSVYGFHTRSHEQNHSEEQFRVIPPSSRDDIIDMVHESKVFDFGTLKIDESDDACDDDSFGVIGNWGEGHPTSRIVDDDNESVCVLTLSRNDSVEDKRKHDVKMSIVSQQT